ncbi:MAG TPA: gliding motility protein GldC [Flavipsychrobacter sp.]|nr:gliding motility protein GldC [Flavipsychrobacter sp.]
MKSEIKIEIALDEEKMPETIEWKAPDGGVDGLQEAKGLLLGLWDGNEKSALRIDLWTKKMMVDEMNEFFYQSLYGMAETYLRATRNEDLAKEMKAFAVSFRKKAEALLEKENG